MRTLHPDNDRQVGQLPVEKISDREWMGTLEKKKSRRTLLLQAVEYQL